MSNFSKQFINESITALKEMDLAPIEGLAQGLSNVRSGGGRLFILGVGEMIFAEGFARDRCGYLSVWGQMNDFSRGIIDSRRLVFDATLVALPLFITVRAVDAWRYE